MVVRETRLGASFQPPASSKAGVAAALTGRRAILNDLSPAAAHLAWNHTRPCDGERLAQAFRRLEAAVGPRLAEPSRRLPEPVLAPEGATSYWASVVASLPGHRSTFGARGTS